MVDVELLQRPEQTAVLLQPERMQILEKLREPGSASAIARRMELPRQQVNYHLRELEKAGLVEFVEERKRGNCLERVVQATARSYVVSPEALGPLYTETAAAHDRFSIAYLLSTAARCIRDLGILRNRALEAGKRLATLTMESEIRFANAADRSAFAEELAGEMARLIAKYNRNQPGSRAFRIFVGAYPVLTHPPTGTRPHENAKA